MDFDKELDRRQSHSVKWDYYKGTEVEPFWVADMDFAAPDAVVDALHERIDHPVFGYTLPPDELNEVVIKRLAEQYNWQIKKEWLVWLPGIVSALEISCRAYGGEGGDVMTLTPIYPPFMTAPKHSGQKAIAVPFSEDNGRWFIDFTILENAITDKTQLLLLCNPHNPVGRVFRRDELEQLAALAEKYDLTICSDEIHCELILEKDLEHIPIATMSKAIEQRTVTLMAPSKTFNIAGLSCAFAIIPDRKRKLAFQRSKEGIVSPVNALGFTAALAAYRDAEEWHIHLLNYLRNNRDILEEMLNDIPGLSVSHVEATYLAWIDCRDLPVKNPTHFFEKVNVGLSCGIHFGLAGFVRFNFACPRSRMTAALERMIEAVQNIEV